LGGCAYWIFNYKAYRLGWVDFDEENKYFEYEYPWNVFTFIKSIKNRVTNGLILTLKYAQYEK
jgi:hypothetical protein